MATKPNKDGIRMPVIEELTDYAYKVGEISFRREWIPKGKYKGVVKNLKEKIGNYKIQLVYLPDTDDNILVYLPPILLPSGFYATPFPANVTERNDKNNLNCGVGTEPKDFRYVYPFDEGGDLMGICDEGAEQMERYAKELRELFESVGKNSQTKSGINAIHLRKEIKLSSAHLEKSERLLRKNRFEKAIFETRSVYVDPERDGFISEWRIKQAKRDHADFDQAVLSTSYNSGKGTPNLSILLYSSINSMLTAGDFEFLEEFSGLF